jgi:hypothetical protein
MLNAQGMVDLLLELNVRVDFVKHRQYLITHFDCLHGRIRCFKRNLTEQRLRGLNGAERWLLGGRANS